MDIKFRQLNIRDYEGLIKLWKTAKLDYKPKGRDSKSNIAIQLKNENCFFLIAEINKKIIGSVFATHDGRKGWINRLAVMPDYRRRGLALDLINKAENILHANGIDIIACLIEGWNTKSMKLFEKANYKKFKGVAYYTKRRYPEV